MIERVQGDRQGIERRLASIEGHIRAIRKMVLENAYCVDVLKQTFAVERALQKFESEVLREHLASCVPDGFKSGRDVEMRRELNEIFELSRK